MKHQNMSKIVNLERCKVWLEYSISVYECAVTQSLNAFCAVLNDFFFFTPLLKLCYKYANNLPLF